MVWIDLNINIPKKMLHVLTFFSTVFYTRTVSSKKIWKNNLNCKTLLNIYLKNLIL